MQVSQKSQYALRAVFELARRQGQGPVKIAEIAREQAIPVRFLEVILGQLKQAGFVESRRGNEGGYILKRSPQELTIGEVMEFIEGPIGPIECLKDQHKGGGCPSFGDCVFMSMWQKVQEAISSVYDTTTFGDLLEEDEKMSGRYVPCYSI